MPNPEQYKLLAKFRETFEGQPYLHRNSSLGDRIADCLYEDLFAVSMKSSEKFRLRIEGHSRVLNPKKRTPGIKARRGDGSFGDIIPNTT